MSTAVLTVVIGSKNPVKINAVSNALAAYFPQHQILATGIDAPSGVTEQPMTSKETRDGAVNRLRYCQSQYPEADFCAAIEGGVDNFEDGAATFAYLVVATPQQMSVGRSANMPIPSSVYDALTKGAELGPLMDEIFNTTNVKQKGGAIGLLTNGLETRESNYTQALHLAIAPLVHCKPYL